MSTASTEHMITNVRLQNMTEDYRLQISVLGLMGPGLWPIWMISAFGALEKYAEPQEYEEFLERFSYLLEQRVVHGVW